MKDGVQATKQLGVQEHGMRESRGLEAERLVRAQPLNDLVRVECKPYIPAARRDDSVKQVVKVGNESVPERLARFEAEQFDLIL